jgi:hypothetical protein
MPLPVRQFTARSIRRLESDPEGESKSSGGCYPQGLQFELEYALGDLEFYIDVMFRYESEPGRLTVFQIL